MKIGILRWVMAFAWTLDKYADEFVGWAEERYTQELHRVGVIR